MLRWWIQMGDTQNIDSVTFTILVLVFVTFSLTKVSIEWIALWCTVLLNDLIYWCKMFIFVWSKFTQMLRVCFFFVSAYIVSDSPFDPYPSFNRDIHTFWSFKMHNDSLKTRPYFPFVQANLVKNYQTKMYFILEAQIERVTKAYICLRALNRHQNKTSIYMDPKNFVVKKFFIINFSSNLVAFLWNTKFGCSSFTSKTGTLPVHLINTK